MAMLRSIENFSLHFYYWVVQKAVRTACYDDIDSNTS